MKIMKRLFRFGKTEKENENGSWPTARERVVAANHAQNSGATIMSAQSAQNNSVMVVCPMVGKELLRKYEDGRHRSKSRSSHDTDGSDSERISDGKGQDNKKTNENQPRICLQKPVKPNRLLQHALTNANGDDWRRQRPLVQRALGDASVVRQVAVPAAVEAALERIQTNGSPNKNQHTTLEVRSFALDVAIATMIASVFGRQQVEPQTYQEIQQGIQQLFFPSLLPIRGDAAKAAALDDPVRKLIQTLATKRISLMTSNNTDTSESCTESNQEQPQQEKQLEPCLALNLLQNEKEGSETLLLREEVIGNCHSALLAGTQTIATTLAGSMLHLAEYSMDEIYSDPDNIPDKAWFRAVVQETLRILPPVATLPRCPVNDSLIIPTSTAASTRTCGGTIPTTTLPERGILLMDILSMAHNTMTSENDTNNDSTWKFCPHQKITSRGNEDEDSGAGNNTRKTGRASYPWGFGDRICPAGNLSVSCISAVLESLVTKEQWSWRLSKPADGSVGQKLKGTQEGWLKMVSYEPTLTYPNPLYLTLNKKNH